MKLLFKIIAPRRSKLKGAPSLEKRSKGPYVFSIIFYRPEQRSWAVLYVGCLVVCHVVTHGRLCDPSVSKGLNLQKLDNILLRGVYAVHLILGFLKQKGTGGDIWVLGVIFGYWE